jgi:hypothetical protein
MNLPMHMWSAEPVATPPDRRRARRRSVTVAAQTRDRDTPPVPVTVTDLTAQGCRIEGDIALVEGAEIWLGIPGIAPRRARVAWADGGEAGCQFYFPVRGDVVDDVARSSTRDS